MYGAMINRSHCGDPVAKVMSWPVATVDDGATLAEVVEELAADEIGVVLVLAAGRLVGMISERDVIPHVAAGADLAHLSAGDVMVIDLVTVEDEATVLEAAQAMDESQIRHLPVMRGTRLAGVVSMRDLLTVLLGDADHGLSAASQQVSTPPGT
jgi:CBS domain-containing protein